MTTLMQNWIGPVALEELSAAYDCFEPDYPPAQATESGRFTCSKGTVTIRLKKGRHIQIIDFNSRRRTPFDVTISDGTTKIRATFGPACTKEFSRVHDKKFTDGTLGGILAIEDYSLIFNPKLGPLKTLTLKVFKFKLLGSEGSSPFGRPSDIAEKPDLHVVMAKLKNLLRCERYAALQVEDESPTLSQIDPFGMRTGQSSPASSTGLPFATQVFAETVGHGSGEAANTKLSPPGKSKFVSILALEQKKRERRSSKDKKGTSNVRSTQGMSNTSNPCALGSLACQKVIEVSPKWDDRANGKHDDRFVSQSPIEYTKEQDLLAQQSSMISSPSKDSERENSQEDIGWEQPQPSKVPDVLSTVNHEDDAMQVLTLDDDTNGFPFDGLKRIPRSYVRVPEEQHAILERNNSWFELGFHNASSSINNIPPTVLQELNLFASRIAAQRVPSHANDLRSEHGIRNDDYCSDVDEMDGAAEDNEERSHIKNTPGSVALRKPGSVPSSPSLPMGERGTLNEGKGGCPTIGSSPGVDIDDSNEHMVDYQDETDVESPVSWPSSPHPGHESKNESVLDSGGAQLPSSLTELEIDVDELPRLNVGGRLINTHATVKTAKLIDATFPSSSLASEVEFQMEELHPIGEPIDENADEETVSQEALTDPPPTAFEDQVRRTIQVEQTPNPNLQRFEKPAVLNKLPRGRKRRMEEIPSDPVIPCTASERRSKVPQEQSSGNVQFKSQSISTTKETDKNESYFINTQASVDEGVDRDQDSMPDHLALVEVEGTQPTMSSLSKVTCGFQGASNKPKRVTPLKGKTGNLTTFPVPEPDPLEGDRMLEVRELLADEAPSIPESPGHPQRRRRKSLRFANWKFSQEEYPAKDIDDMVRASRRDFNAKFAASKADEDAITNTPLPTSAISQPDSDPTPGQRPSTLSDVYQPRGPYSPAVVQSDTTSMIESTPAISVASLDVLESQMSSTLHDKTESARRIVEDEQPSKDDSLAANHIPEPANQITAYDKFIRAYPDYQGTEEQFINGLVYIEWLVNKKGKNFLRKSLWDDLLRVLADDYVDYVQGPITNGERMKGLEFYNELDQDPVFKNRIITPSNLQNFILSLDIKSVEEVRRVYGIRHTPKGTGSAEISPRSEPFTTFKPPTPDRPRIQEREKDLRMEEPENDLQDDEDLAVILQEKSSMSVIQADDQSATGKPLFFETRSQVQKTQREGAAVAVASPGKTLARPINDSAKRTTPEQVSVEMHSQTQADQTETTSDTIIEPDEVSPASSFKKPRRSLPWAEQSSTTVPSETRPVSGNPHGHRRFSELPSKLSTPRSQAQKERPSDPGAKPMPKARSSMPSAEDYDPFSSPKPRALHTTARKFKSLPNTRVEKSEGTKAYRDAGSDRKVKFLTEFARNWKANEMSSTTTPEPKRIRRF